MTPTNEERKLRGDGISTMIPDSLFDTDLTPAEFKLWCYYSLMGNSDMSIREASEGSGISIGAVSSSRRSLYDKGWIDKPSRTPVTEGHVYLIEMVGKNIYKIGLTTQNPTSRFQDISTGVPFSLNLLGTIITDNVFSLEKHFHNHYKNRGLWVKGEWFSLEDEDLDYFFLVKEKVERI